MKVWPIDPLDPRDLRLEVPEKLPQVSLRNLQLRFFLISTLVNIFLRDNWLVAAKRS